MLRQYSGMQITLFQIECGYRFTKLWGVWNWMGSWQS